MGKTYLQEESEKHYKTAIRLRDPCCQVCGTPGTECHHIYFQSQGNWEVLFDLDYGVGLCAEHHRGCAQAPHVSAERFEAEFLPIILHRMEPARAAKVQAYRPTVAPGRADFKSIRKRLKETVETLDRENYMDADCVSA